MIARILITLGTLFQFIMAQSPTCSTGEYWNDQLCVDCLSSRCICTSPGGCSDCVDGYVLVDNTCIRCQDNCKTCNADRSECTACSDEDDIIIDGVCVQVDSGDAFDGNYYSLPNRGDVQSGVNLYDDASLSGCSAIDSKTFRCTACSDGRVLTVSGECEWCPNRCQSCSSSSQCNQCQSGYFLDPNSDRCDECENNCSECSGPNTCTKCHEGYFLSGSSCSNCPNDCTECSSASTCTKCRQNYKLDSNQCKSCRDLFGNNCSTCNGDLSACTQCRDGYYLDSSATPPTCNACPANQRYCSKGSDGTIVPIQCSNGYILHTDASNVKVCQLNTKDCVTTKSGAAYECTGCPAGRQLVLTECKTCSINRCAKCTFDSTSGAETCNECDNGFEVQGNACTAITTPDGTGCKDGERARIEGTDKTSTACIRCPFGCKTCTRTGCTACNQGYILSGGICYTEISSDFCLKRGTGTISDSQGNCEECIKGFRLVNGFCRKCFSFMGGFQCNVTAGFDADIIDSCVGNAYLAYPLSIIVLMIMALIQ